MRKKITIDEDSGSMAYNRLDFQISQAVLFAVALYNNKDFLIVMDQYDDVSIFNKSIKPKDVEFYQLKTNDVSISFSTIISEKWLAKLYKQKEREFNVKKLVLMTNCALQNGSTKFTKDELNFASLDKDLKKKIINHLKKELNLPSKVIDLSDMFHIRTTLSLMDHKSQAEKEVENLLLKIRPNIKVQTVRCISDSLISLLSKRQSYEKNPVKASFKKIRETKGISKSDFNDIIDIALRKSLPDFYVLKKYVEFPNEQEACCLYSQLQGDLMADDVLLDKMVNQICSEMKKIKKEKMKSCMTMQKGL